MKTGTAFSPGHITGFFQICDRPEDPLEKGSRGAGVSVERGVTTTVRLARARTTSIQIRINGHSTSSAPVTEKVITAFLALNNGRAYRFRVKHDVRLPIGCGFGTSGAGALSLALALNEGFELGLSRIRAAQIAHIAEVECKTGLGSVIAETYGGIEIRVKPGAPGIGELQTLPCSEEYVVICLPFGPLSTAKFLTNQEDRRRINEMGGELTDALLSRPSISNLLIYSHQFAKHLQLLTERAKRIILEANELGIICSTAIFGENIFTIVHRDQIQEADAIFRPHVPKGHEPLIMKIDTQGARVLNG